MSDGVLGTQDVYTQGDIVLQFPVQASTTFLFVILISAVLEFGIDTAADVQNKYFRVMFDAINQEVMIVGLLVLACAFAQTVYDWPSRWVLIFQWAMMVLFFMAIFFVCLVSYVLAAVNFTTKRWLLFEIERMDSGQELSGRELQYKLAFNRFQNALQAFGYDASMGIRFSEYLAKLMRRNIVALTDLTWVCWVCLATLVILNTLRSEGTRRLSQLGDENLENAQTANQRVVQYLSFIVVIGYGILATFLTMHFLLSRRLNEFLNSNRAGGDGPNGANARPHGGAEQGLLTRDDLEDSKAHLFRRSREATTEMLQVVILALEWYTATFFLSFSNEIVTNLGWGIAVPLFIAAALPAIVFSVVIPWTLTIITLLSSLGTNLDEDSVRYLILKHGVPEAEWPPHMREALRKARTNDDAASTAAALSVSIAGPAMDPSLYLAGNASFSASPGRNFSFTANSFAALPANQSGVGAARTVVDGSEAASSRGPSRPLPRGLDLASRRREQHQTHRTRDTARHTDAFLSL